jgi:DNA-binding NtrC family response regulator
MRSLARHPFPGNLRELRAVVEQLAEGRARGAPVTGADVDRALSPVRTEWPARYAEALTAFKTHVVEAALERSGGNQAEASRQLGIHPSNLIRLMRTLGIKGR